MSEDTLKLVAARRKEDVKQQLKNDPDKYEKLLDMYEACYRTGIQFMHERDQWKDKAIKIQSNG